jgi:hypothetical protein
MHALPHRYRVKGSGRITCLISSSLKAAIVLDARVEIAAAQAVPA